MPVSQTNPDGAHIIPVVLLGDSDVLPTIPSGSGRPIIVCDPERRFPVGEQVRVAGLIDQSDIVLVPARFGAAMAVAVAAWQIALKADVSSSKRIRIISAAVEADRQGSAVMSANAALSHAQKHTPEVFWAARRAVDGGTRDANFIYPGARAMASAWAAGLSVAAAPANNWETEAVAA